MAKLHDYHILCPLIDQKSFLGVSQDKKPEHVIVTLGRNVVNKYRLSDQKQISGWTSKDHITSPVIYYKEQKNYVGVFNLNMIKIWDEDVVNLDKLKKYKFSINILKLLPRDDQPPLVIFNNGNCAALPYAIDNRKTYDGKSLFKDTDVITDVATCKLNNKDHICYVVDTKSDGYEIVVSPLREELGDMERVKIVREKVVREDAEVVGVLISVKERPTVFVMWNDSKLSAYHINTKTWKSIGTVQWISTKSSVSMAWMAKNHLIIFGSNIDQDGAILIAYNFALGVGSCKYPMKMYKENAKIYCCSDRILLEASNHIGMLPFTLEIKRNLSSLLGSHEITTDDSPVVADWGTPTTPVYEYTQELKESVTQGITERSACAQSIPLLLEKAKPAQIMSALNGFKDIPESIVTLLLNYSMKLINSTEFEQTNPKEVKKLYHEADTTVRDQLELLNRIFRINFCDALLIPHLRNAISVKDSLFLLLHIEHLLSDFRLDPDYESKLYDWCAVILDAFYQQYLLCKDSSVQNVLEHLHKSVSQWIIYLFRMSRSIAELNKLMSGNNNVNNEEYLPYTIEMMQI